MGPSFCRRRRAFSSTRDYATSTQAVANVWIRWKAWRNPMPDLWSVLRAANVLVAAGMFLRPLANAEDSVPAEPAETVTVRAPLPISAASQDTVRGRDIALRPIASPSDLLRMT